jgi:hypothetical protein
LINHPLDRVVKASVDSDPPLFSIGANFVNPSLTRRFTNATMFITGCSTFKKADLAPAFLARSASA